MRIDELLIQENATVLEAMERLDKVAKKVLFIESDGKLSASLTDGDIRRWILAQGDLKGQIKRIANYNPHYLYEGDENKAKCYMKKHSIEALPIVSFNKKIQTVIMWDEKDVVKEREIFNIPVVVMAGGQGKRLYPYTKILPKPLIPVGERPIIEHIIDQFKKCGCQQFYLILNHKKNMIKAYFDDLIKDYMIHFIEEKKPLGTGGGLQLLKGKINSTFILSNCDILIREDIEKIYRFHKAEGNLITMVCSLKNYTIPYGIIEIDENGRIDTIKEKPQLSFLTNTGCYFVEPGVIQNMESEVYIGFPEIVEQFKKKGMKVGVFPISDNSWLDMGELGELEKMRTAFEVEK